MPPTRKILIADADPETLRLLAPPLRQRGYQVHSARDGSRALQIAILRFPDLVLLDDATPLLDTRTFVRILRTNPRTERIPVVLTGKTLDPDRARLGSFLQKPLVLDEVLARIEQIFRRADASRAAGESRELEGNLAQIPLTDLLQILAVNRKSGRLTVEREGEKAEVTLAEGRVVDAQLGAVGAEKALWRLLTRREGQFAFLPAVAGTAAAPERITRRLDDLLLEGLRQADELARLAPSLPAARDRVELLVAPADLPGGLHPVTAEVVALLGSPRPFGELVDRCRASDLEASRGVAALLERGFARLREAAAPAPPARLLAPHELHALRGRIAAGRASGARAVGKVVVAGGGPLARAAARLRFASVPGFTPEAEGGEAGGHATGGFGTIGRLQLGDGVRVDLVELPGEPEQAPLWRPFAAGALGALVLLPADDEAPRLEALARAQRLPLVVCGPAPDAIADPAEGLRALLAGGGVAAPRGTPTGS
jgi:DNA-binding response OmpR family regulator